METLQTHIASICPSVFNGTYGDLFAGAIAAVVAAHCTIFNDYQWPEDKAHEIIRFASDSISYDFIIVGAGTAGSLLAGRLANSNPSWRILLIEAGDDPGILSEIPSLLFSNLNTEFDWKYETEPNNESCLGFKNKRCIWSKGKAISGSSAINAMLYIRGHPKDYDTWKDLGNPGWGYDDLKPYFEKLENELKLSDYKYQDNPFYEIIGNASEELGINSHEKNNNEALIGTKICKLLTSNGKRLNTAKIYLNHTKNLHVMKNTVVQRVVIDAKTKTAVSVEVRHNSGVDLHLISTKEVILSAGSIATPQILMLSGIGPKKHLIDKGIDCLLDLPVGKNLQDHTLFPIYLPTNLKMTLTLDMTTLYILQYMLMRTGPFSSIGITDFMTFIDTKNISNYPDIQFHHTNYFMKDNFILRSYLEALRYDEEIIQAVEKLNEDHFLFGIFPTLLHPKSVGEVLLSDKDPQNPPIIKTGYLKNHEDVETLLKAIAFIHKLEDTTAFKALEMKITKVKIPGCLQYTFDTKPYWECYIRHMLTTLYHPVGTARMGLQNGNSVVNHELLVHGIKHLRIVDASVMPQIPRGNTMASTLVIAEKAVDIIKKQYTLKDAL